MSAVGRLQDLLCDTVREELPDLSHEDWKRLTDRLEDRVLVWAEPYLQAYAREVTRK